MLPCLALVAIVCFEQVQVSSAQSEINREHDLQMAASGGGGKGGGAVVGYKAGKVNN